MSDQSHLYFQQINSLSFPFNRKDILQYFTCLTFKPNEKIFEYGDYCNKLFIVESGRVKIGSYTEEGRLIIRSIIFKNETFGELGITEGGVKKEFAQAIDLVKVNAIDIPTLKNVIKLKPELNLFIINSMSKRIRTAEIFTRSLFLKSSRTRVIEFIYNLAKKEGQRIGYEIVVRGFLLHRDIGDMTASSRQTVTTTLNELKKKNILTFDRKRLLIRNMDALIAEAV